ncbi:hypothetical protein [Haladaptatus sp. DFWS20]|uniref:hypothetical protein n=1 Tax=Haladaptatus sp. DFWS20 TaxID=3403467 RepID=UPI003EB7B82F
MTDGWDGENTDERDEPLADLAAEVESRRTHEPTANRREFEDAFTEVTVEDVDVDDLWADLEAEDSGDLVVSAPREESENDRDVRMIPKTTCHGCPQFAEPPTVRCTHEGTDILAMVDTEQFRVADCPMVVDEDTPLNE